MHAAYDGIYFELKRLIEEGVYPYRTFLPSESMLVKRFGCAHNTVRKALAALASEGYAQPIHGKGVRVIYQSFSSNSKVLSGYAPMGIESFHDTSERCGFVGATHVMLMETITADQELVARTYFEPNETLLHLERIRSYDGVPLSRESNYFRADAVRGISKQDAETSVYRYIESIGRQRLVTSKRRVIVEPANERDSELLELGDATYLAVMRILTFDNDGLQCEYSELRYHPDIFSLYQTTVSTRIK